MNRLEFLKTTFGLAAVSHMPLPLLAYADRKRASLHSDPLQFLGSDQNGNKVILFSNKNADKSETQVDWKFETAFPPTDAKRVDVKNRISVIISTHGRVYETPQNFKGKFTFADVHKSCHSIEKLPDGNLISASSNDNLLTIHYAPKDHNQDSRVLSKSIDFPFEDAHGVVFDRQRNLIWALGSYIGKFEYVSDPNHPRLNLLDLYQLPVTESDAPAACDPHQKCADKIIHSGGHDIFPDHKGDLLITSHQAILKLEIGKFALAKEIYSMCAIKSIMSNANNGEIFYTSPQDIPGYQSWQTDTVVSLDHGPVIRMAGAKFYKVRLWQKNSFSYK